MASVKKFTDAAVSKEIDHNNREIKKNSNTDIDPSRSKDNYSFPLDHGGLTDFEYYKKRVGETYLYGRGTAREKNAITACGWVITLPKEISGNLDKERAFFRAVLDFIAHRYGEKNIINNEVHHDESGQPHIQIIFTPIIPLDHNQVHYKTVKTKTAAKTETGRYEYTYRYKLDDNGEKIPVKSYAKMSDYFDEKIAAAEVVNRAELRHFHNDMQRYLVDHGIEGVVVNGATNGKNLTVKSMKEFTKATGMTIDEVRTLQSDIERLKEEISHSETIRADISSTLTKKEETLQRLQTKIIQKDHTIETATEKIKTLSEQLQKSKTLEESLRKNLSIEKSLSAKTEENYVASQIRNQQLESQLKQAKIEIENLKNKEVEHTREWGKGSDWGTTQSWGNHTIKQEEEKIW